MKPQLLNSLAAIKSQAEENFATKFESLEDAFIDAYENGEFHEHSTEGCWRHIGTDLTDEMIAHLVPTVLRPLVNHVRGDEAQMKRLMDFHEEMVKWLEKRLKDTTMLFQALRDTRHFIMEDAKRLPEAKAWLMEVLRLLSLIQMAIESRMGMETYSSAEQYERLIVHLAEGKK